jgi:hypothetical protein
MNLEILDIFASSLGIDDGLLANVTGVMFLKGRSQCDLNFLEREAVLQPLHRLMPTTFFINFIKK